MFNVYTIPIEGAGCFSYFSVLMCVSGTTLITELKMTIGGQLQRRNNTPAYDKRNNHAYFKSCT